MEPGGEAEPEAEPGIEMENPTNYEIENISTGGESST